MKKAFIHILPATLALMFLIMLAVPTKLLAAQSRYEGKKVLRIEFRGLENNNSADLLQVMKTTVGFPLKASEVREDIKKIFKKGKLQKVKVEIREYKDGVQLRLICEERPVVRVITIKGTKELYDSDLKEALPLKENEVFRKDLMERSIIVMKQKYREEGFFNVLIKTSVDKMKDSNRVKVTFIVDEGEEIRVRKIIFMGTDSMDARMLKGFMDTKEKWLFNEGVFDRKKYEMDKVKLLAWYRQNGYLDAQILEDKVEYQWVDPTEKKDRGIFITIRIREGEKYYFDSYSVTIIPTDEKPVFKPETFMKKFELQKKGELFDNTKYMKDRQSISFSYATRGYIFARVIPKRTIEEREVTVDGKKLRRKFVRIDFTVTEGTQAYIENIIVKGNKKTKDRVIRREILLKEGDLFDSQKMQISREKIFNLGFFKEVNIDVRPGSRQGYMNLIVDVEEQPSGSISLGGGYGTTTGFSIFADISENNLLGNGQRIGVKLEYGPIRGALTLKFTEPWLFNIPLALNLSVFYQNYTIETTSLFPNSSDLASYRKEAFGYSLGLGYRFWNNWITVGSTWTHTFITYKEATGNSPDTIFKAADLGLQEKRSLSLYTFFDNRDNYFNPTKGLRTGITVTSVGGWLGGGDHYMKFRPEFYLYFTFFHLPFLKTHPVVFEIRASGSFMQEPLGEANQNPAKNEWLELEDRLTIGGPETLRGWNYYDPDFPTSWRSVGMFHRILFGFEIRIPIEPRMLWLALFFDAGSLWSDPFWEAQIQRTSDDLYNYISDDKSTGDLKSIDEFADTDLLKYFRYSYGFGFRVQIPMLPLRFWFGQKLIFNGETFKNVPNGFNFQFSIGDFRF